MQGAPIGRRAQHFGLAIRRAISWGALAGALLATGCTNSAGPILGNAGSGGTTVAFESIDGPPEPVFYKLVEQLTREANARQIAVVSRQEPAQYRIRGYVAAHVQGKRTTLAWVWDVYNGEQERAVRLAGEVASSERAWAAADDRAIAQIARDSMDRLTTFLAAEPGTSPSLLPPPPREQSPNVAFRPREAAPNVALAPAPGGREDGTLAYAPPQSPH
jgi:hypothetical protein